jgi:acyl carrier protein
VNISERLIQLLKQEITQAGTSPPAQFTRATVLASTGLDSLGFATLVVAMSKELGLDPFAGSDEIIYPETFGELLDLYEAPAAGGGESKP